MNVRRFVSEGDYGFSVHMADARTQLLFQVSTLPTVVILSTRGEIVAYSVGAQDEAAITQALTRAR